MNPSCSVESPGKLSCNADHQTDPDCLFHVRRMGSEMSTFTVWLTTASGGYREPTPVPQANSPDSTVQSCPK